MDANRAEAKRCIDIAKSHLSNGRTQQAKKFALKAKKLSPDIEIVEIMERINVCSSEKNTHEKRGDGDSGDQRTKEGDFDYTSMNGSTDYAHFDHYNENEPCNARSRRQKFHASQSQPTFKRPTRTDSSQQNDSSCTTQNASSRTASDHRSRTRSADRAQLGKDFTQEEFDTVQRIRHCKDYYEILNVSKDADEALLKKQYRKVALRLHPDKCRVPGATEAFKALGNAYAVLSNAEKRQRYDMYGNEQPQVRRRQNDFYEYDFSRGFEADFTPEEIFNMFFGGGYPTGAMNRRQFHFRQHHSRHAQEQPNYGPLIQLLPLLAIFILGMIGQLMVGEPAYSLQRTNKYTEERYTVDLRVQYFVKSDFVKNYKGRIEQIEHQVEDEYVSNLRVGCYRERSQKETMAWRARTFGDAALWERAQRMSTPNCDRLQQLYG